MQQQQVLRLDVGVKIGRQREHHSLHARERGHRQPDQHFFALALGLRFVFLGVVGRGAVAGFAHGKQDVGQADAAFIPAHPRALGAVIEFGAFDAGQAHQFLLDQPHAGGAGNAAEHQHCFATVVGLDFDKLGLHFGQVVQFELCQHFRRRQHRAFGFGGAVLVIAAQSGVDNALGNGLAAGAAGRLFVPFVTYGIAAAGGNGQAAVEAGRFVWIHGVCGVSGCLVFRVLVFWCAVRTLRRVVFRLLLGFRL